MWVPNEALATVRLVPEKRGGGYLEWKQKEAVKKQVQFLPFGLSIHQSHCPSLAPHPPVSSLLPLFTDRPLLLLLR